jgi:hypothetical protein
MGIQDDDYKQRKFRGDALTILGTDAHMCLVSAIVFAKLTG